MANAQHNVFDYIELPVASTDELASTKKFYGQVFGWEYQDWAPVYADTHSSGVTSGLSVDAARVRRPLPVIYSTDLEQSRKEVLAAGAKLTVDIFSFPGGRRFHFADPAGNELAIWSKA